MKIERKMIYKALIHYIYITILLSISDLLHCTEEPNVSIPTLANLLIERAQSPNWIVVFKSLVTIHHLMCYGNEVRMIMEHTN